MFSGTHLKLMSTDAVASITLHEICQTVLKWSLFTHLNILICRISQNFLCQSRALWTTISPIVQKGVVQLQLRWVLLNNFANDDGGDVQISTQCDVVDH